MSRKTVVSVLIPTRNEVGSIRRCIEAVGGQDYPLDLIEVVVVDACSDDGTAEAAAAASRPFPFRSFRVFANEKGTTPANLNTGLAVLEGAVVCRVDARSFIPRQYVRRCVALLASRPDVAVVGGFQAAIPPRPGTVGRGIARALNNPLATGLSRYRRRGASGPSDTVYLGSFRRDELRRVGGWDERFSTNQDYQLNRRMRNGGLVWFDSGLAVEYLPRRSFTDLAAQYRRFGRWKSAAWLEGDVRVANRQAGVLLVGVTGLALGLAGLRRHPLRTWIGLTTVALAVDLAAGPGAAGDRVAAVCALAVIDGCWLLGVAEQALRYLGGERLLQG